MSNDELIKRYLEETGCLENDSNLLIMAYGSRIYKHENQNSDLDVLIVTSSRGYYRETQLIDGIEVETTIISIEELYNSMASALIENNSYYDSIFKNAYVIRDDMNLLLNFQTFLEDSKKSRKKRSNHIPPKMLWDLYEMVNCCLEYTDNWREYYYVNALELIRIIYSLKGNYSSINMAKFYRMYSDISYARDYYALSLPPKAFIDDMLNAISDCSNENLSKLLKYIDYDNTDFDNLSYMDSYQLQDIVRIKSILIHMNKMVLKVEDMLLNNSNEASYVYLVVLDSLKKFYLEIYGGISDEFNIAFINAVEEKDIEKRIKLLEKLFNLLEGVFAFDYQDYCLRLK